MLVWRTPVRKADEFAPYERPKLLSEFLLYGCHSYGDERANRLIVKYDARRVDGPEFRRRSPQ